MEMIWRPSISTAVPKDLFTHAFYHGYYYFDTFCLDVRCNDSPIMTDPRLEGYNLEERTDTFA